tara:strand:- start:40356 stop:42806 length:2451 start_codon:yes stop_codon:yes gene_type:complete
MKYIKITLSIAALVVSNFIQSQKPIGSFENIISEIENSIQLKTTNGVVQIEFCTPSIIRFRTSWNNVFEANEPWMVTKYSWSNVRYKKTENTNSLDFETDKLRIHIQKSPLVITVYDATGKILLSEITEDTVASGALKNKETVGVVKQLMPNEHFFGFGERMDFLDQRGKKLSLNVGRGQGLPHFVGAYNVLKANYSPIPFFMSTQGYGVFFHNANPTHWDMGHSSSTSYSFEAEGGELDYYFIYGPDFTSILDGYTDITGKSPLLPKFALGLHVGTYSGGTWGHEAETSTAYVVNLVKKFRELEIPLDVLHLDSTWRIFGENGGKGATSFEWRETFDNPDKMFADLYALNLNMVGLHLRPRFDNGKKLRLLDAAQQKGYVYPEDNGKGEFVNFFDQKSVDWWWDNGVMRVAKQGAMFLKTDEGSAFGHKANESDKVGPQGKDIKALHNLFPLAYAKAPYEKFQEYNQIRGMNQTREGYAGIQRYPYIFAGDWPSEWQYFEPVIKAGLNIGLSGVGNWAHCMGGFEHVADPELYIRWCQFGLLSPIAHLFGMEHPNYKEPWNYGEEATRIFKQYDDLRYSLIPYLYSASYEMHETGKPLMRALVLDYQTDENVYDVTDQYMLGKNLMICPVTEKGAKTRVVYLPEGNWINYWSGEQYNGKQYLSVLCPIDQVPIFIKDGAILPTQEVVNYVGEKDIDIIFLDIYPTTKSSFSLYDDDGKSLNYQKGDFTETFIEVTDDGLYTRITIEKPKGAYQISNRTYILNIHFKNTPKAIEINKVRYPIVDSKNLNSGVSYENGVLSFPVNFKNEAGSIVIEN